MPMREVPPAGNDAERPADDGAAMEEEEALAEVAPLPTPLPAPPPAPPRLGGILDGIPAGCEKLPFKFRVGRAPFLT